MSSIIFYGERVTCVRVVGNVSEARFETDTCDNSWAIHCFDVLGVREVRCRTQLRGVKSTTEDKKSVTSELFNVYIRNGAIGYRC